MIDRIKIGSFCITFEWHYDMRSKSVRSECGEGRITVLKNSLVGVSALGERLRSKCGDLNCSKWSPYSSKRYCWYFVAEWK